jgi:hypothetical protein
MLGRFWKRYIKREEEFPGIVEKWVDGSPSGPVGYAFRHKSDNPALDKCVTYVDKGQGSYDIIVAEYCGPPCRVEVLENSTEEQARAAARGVLISRLRAEGLS